jgi:hypothetical protein
VDLWWLLGLVSRGLSGMSAVLLIGAVVLLLGKAIGAGLQVLPVRRMAAAFAWVVLFTAACLVAALTPAALTALLISTVCVVATAHWWHGASRLVDLEAVP